jgi:hypothetical protein
MISTILITNQIEKLEVKPEVVEPEFIQAMASAMSVSEELVGVCTGQISFGRACVVITSKRVMLMRRGLWSSSLTQSHISLENVTAVECHVGKKSGKLGIWNGTAYGEIAGVESNQCQAVANALDLASLKYKEAMMKWTSGPIGPVAARAA